MNKYNARHVEIDGIRFDSMAEARRYQELRLLEQAGAIRKLRIHTSFALVVNGVKVGTYKDDFDYEEETPRTWEPVVEDVKGVKTAVYQLKRKLMKAIYGIDIGLQERQGGVILARVYLRVS